jgi:hypothetical protein
MASETRPTGPAPAVDMSPEAISARLRRVVELNRLCRSLAAARPVAQDGQGKDAAPAPAVPPATVTAR